MSRYKDNDLCQECGVMDAVTVAGDKEVCYRCAKKLRKNGRKAKDKYESWEEKEDADRQNRRAY